jgi:FtsH-binding integral membrane protein
LAFAIAVAGFVGMTIYAFCAKTDLTVWWALIFGLSLAFLVACIIALFVRNKIFHIVLCFVGVGLGLFYVAYDTQLIIGNHKY